MDHSDPYSTHNSSPDMSDDEDDGQWDDDIELNTIMQAADIPAAGPSTATATGLPSQTFSTASSSTSSLNPAPPSRSPASKKKGAGSRKVSKTESWRKTESPYTTKMQDRQARGKDHVDYMFSTDDDSSDNGGYTNRSIYRNAETYESRQRRRLAGIILDNPELLMMHAQARSDSIPGTRHYFTQIMCGYHKPENVWPFTESFEREKASKNRVLGYKRPDGTFARMN